MACGANFSIREMTAQDIDAGLRLCRAAGWNQIETDWALFLQAGPGTCKVAEKDGRVVGTVATLRYAGRFSWVGMMLVDPEERGAGIGSRLFKEALFILRDDPCVRLDATPMGRQLYQQHEFVDEAKLTRLTVIADRARLDSSFSDTRPMHKDDLSAVFKRDLEVFGADRQRLLESLYLHAPEYAWVAGQRSIESYCFGRHGFRYEQMGPVVAANERIAGDLVLQCLMNHTGRRFTIDAPQASPSWLERLASIGFEEERPFVRMRRGDNHYPGKPECSFGILGPEFG
jgi:GNAT superfamily N-acetyltransferase